MVRRSPHVGGGDVIVRLPDDTWCALPCWMLEEGFCARLVDAAAPLLSVSALRSLIRLLDSQAEAVSCSGHENQESPKAAGNFPGATTGTATSAAKSKHSGAGAPAVSAASGRTAHSDHPRRAKGAKP